VLFQQLNSGVLHQQFFFSVIPGVLHQFFPSGVLCPTVPFPVLYQQFNSGVTPTVLFQCYTNNLQINSGVLYQYFPSGVLHPTVSSNVFFLLVCYTPTVSSTISVSSFIQCVILTVSM